MKPRPARSSSAIRLLLSLLVLAGAVYIFISRQAILDQFNNWHYQPSAQVAALTDRAELSDTGRFYFYASRPEIQERERFNQSCTTARGEQVAVLGCYVMQRIYLFNVGDARLDGIKEVTAGHEMLHAAYERMSEGEKQRINELLIAQAANITDENFRSVLAEYEKSEPTEIPNELHSLIGTQVGSIDPKLEEHYAKYFENRQNVVALYAKYESVFTGLKTQQEQLVNEMETIAAQIEQQTNAYNQEIQELNDDIDTFNDRARDGGFTSQAQFNAERGVLTGRQNQLAVLKERVNGLIETYNAKRRQLLAINTQAEELNRNINSNLNPIPAL